MSTSFASSRVARSLALATTVLVLAACESTPPPTVRAKFAAPVPSEVLLPERYAMLLERARRGLLREEFPETEISAHSLAKGMAARGSAADETFRGAYRESAKTSFASGATHSYKTVSNLLAPLPSDPQMAQQFPELLKVSDIPRIALETRNVKIPAWIYWFASEGDNDFHIILGSTAQLTSATIFMNSEISALPGDDPARLPFAQRRRDFRAIMAKNRNVGGLFDPPVAVRVSGSLLWDAEHRAPKAVGPKGLQPAKAWEIHPIKQLMGR
ncbi:MAG: hypothetical protein ACR2HH_05295 [Chthoniobacterales bacterium]